MCTTCERPGFRPRELPQREASSVFRLSFLAECRDCGDLFDCQMDERYGRPRRVDIAEADLLYPGALGAPSAGAKLMLAIEKGPETPRMICDLLLSRHYRPEFAPEGFADGPAIILNGPDHSIALVQTGTDWSVLLHASGVSGWHDVKDCIRATNWKRDPIVRDSASDEVLFVATEFRNHPQDVANAVTKSLSREQHSSGPNRPPSRDLGR